MFILLLLILVNFTDGSKNEKLHSLYRSPSIVRVITSRRLRWARYLARMEEGSSAFIVLPGKPTGKGF